MQRSTWFVALLTAGLVLVLGVQLSAGANRKPRKSRSSAPVTVKPAGPEEVVDGYGSTERSARARALENAQQRVAEMLRDKAGDPNWKPPADLLDPEVLERYGVIAEMDSKPKESVGVDGDRALVARYKVQLTDDYLRAVQKEARQERVGQRHVLLFRVLGGVLAVLLVAAGYLRLEEMTRGYATHLLRLGAFAVLAVVGVALWLTM